MTISSLVALTLSLLQFAPDDLRDLTGSRIDIGPDERDGAAVEG